MSKCDQAILSRIGNIAASRFWAARKNPPTSTIHVMIFIRQFNSRNYVRITSASFTINAPTCGVPRSATLVLIIFHCPAAVEKVVAKRAQSQQKKNRCVKLNLCSSYNGLSDYFPPRKPINTRWTAASGPQEKMIKSVEWTRLIGWTFDGHRRYSRQFWSLC